MRVEMQVGDPVPLFRVAGRILRCHVALLDRERIRYRGALMFDKQLPFGEAATHGVKLGRKGPQARPDCARRSNYPRTSGSGGLVIGRWNGTS